MHCGQLTSLYEICAFAPLFCPIFYQEGFPENRIASCTISMLNTCHSMARVGKCWQIQPTKQHNNRSTRLVKAIGARGHVVYSLEVAYLQFTIYG
jgi:hypothetical protein